MHPDDTAPGAVVRSWEGFSALRYEESQLEPPQVDLLAAVDVLVQEVARLRKLLLKLGHAQELFQGRVEEEVGRLSQILDRAADSPGARETVPGAAQLRTLMELDRAVLHLLAFVQDAGRRALPDDPETDMSPRSVREGLALLQIRVRNLQRSFGLEPIPTTGHPFDDRWHQAYGVCHRPDLADGEVAEEVLPGYRLGGKVVRPALVIVNRETSE
jgi:GrpE